MLLSAVMLLVQLLCVFLLSARAAGTLLAAGAGVRIEVAATAEDQQVQEFYAAVRSQPFVDRVMLVSSEQAYEQQRQRDPDLIAFFETYGLENPFPDTFSVTLSSVDAYDALVEFVRQPRWQGVLTSSFLSAASKQENDMRVFLHAAEGVGTVAWALLILALAVLCFAIVEWVTRATLRRRNELMLERVLGGSPVPIALPLVCEMTALLWVALLAGSIACIGALQLLPQLMPALATESAFRLLVADMTPVLVHWYPWIVLLQAAVLPFAAVGGVWLAMYKSHVPVSGAQVQQYGLLC